MSRITVVCENTATGRGLLGEHGLSFWLEHGDRRILFDTGQGYALKHNAARLDIALETADAIVLSHGHFDHTGGLADALDGVGEAVVFAHPAAFRPRYARNADGTSREIGIVGVDEEAVRAKARLVWTEKPTEVGPGIHVTGPIPRQTEFEDSGGPFFTDAGCQEPDPFHDDQGLFFDTPRGTVVVLGCAHAGIVNTLMYVRELTDKRPLYMVVGGTHLVTASPERLDRTVEALRRFEIQRLLPAHCTGFAAMARLWHEFRSRYTPCAVGMNLDIED